VSTSRDRTADLRQAFDRLAGSGVILFGGKGGVGKTTIASMAALHLAGSRPLVLFTTDPASNLDDLFGPASIANLAVEKVDAGALYRRFLERNLPSFLELGDRGTYLEKEELQRFFELSLPGIDELMSWMRIGELTEEDPDRLVLVDTAPTGHTLRMLGSGAHFMQLVEALDAMQAKHRDMVRQFTRRDSQDAMDAFIDSFRGEGERRLELLRDPNRTAFIPVLLSEPWVVEQSASLIAELRSLGIAVPFAVLNRSAVDDGCALFREREGRDLAARASLAPLAVIDAPRSCVPLDTIGRVGVYLRGSLTESAEVVEAADGPPGDFDAAASSPERLRLRPETRLLFIAGKGGVGKTTSAAAIAGQLARQNPDRRYTALSVDPAHTLPSVFASDAPPGNLTVETIDTRARWRRFQESVGEEIERAVDALTPGNISVAYDTDAIRKLLDIAPPGADELFAISRIAELLSDESQAMIIVDTAPTGHFLRLLDLPASAGDWVRELMRILLRYRQIVPAGSLGEDLVAASRSLHSLDTALISERCGVVVVCRPERIVIAESERLIAELARRGIALTGVIANYVTPLTECRCDRTSRRYELEALATIGRKHRLIVVARREAPIENARDLPGLVESVTAA
jgi:arsenite-transporting ATPase